MAKNLNGGKDPSKGYCATCGDGPVTRESFKDELSVKEYGISGMCQKCQDSVFNAPEYEDQDERDEDGKAF